MQPIKLQAQNSRTYGISEACAKHRPEVPQTISPGRRLRARDPLPAAEQLAQATNRGQGRTRSDKNWVPGVLGGLEFVQDVLASRFSFAGWRRCDLRTCMMLWVRSDADVVAELM